MKWKVFVITVFVILSCGLGLYWSLEVQNQITALQMALPKLKNDLERVDEENNRLEYQIRLFTSPENLMKLASEEQFAHLSYPKYDQILVLRNDPFLNETKQRVLSDDQSFSSVQFAAGLAP